MAENPHKVADEQLRKLVTKQALLRYHHKLVEQLGLTQDEALYVYQGERTDWHDKEGDAQKISVQQALDELYDMAKSGAIEFKSGKAEGVSEENTIKFNTNDNAATNLYWINAKVGDETINIEIDANDFVKDSFLKSVKLITVATTGEGETATTTYKDNAGNAITGDELAAFIEAAKKTEEKPADGVYFFYTWEVENGEKENTYTYTAIALKDIYGDIKGDDYITFDSENTQIKAQTADVKDEDTKQYLYTLNNQSGDVLTTDEIAAIITSLENTYEGSTVSYDAENDRFKITSDSKITVLEQAGDETTFTVEGKTLKFGGKASIETGHKNWYVDSEEETNLATAENLADVANELQQEIEDNAKKNNLLDGEVTLSTEDDDHATHTLTADVTEDGSKYKLDLIVMDDDEVDDFFKECGDQPTPKRPEPETANQDIFATNNNGEAVVDNATETNTGITNGTVTQG